MALLPLLIASAHPNCARSVFYVSGRDRQGSPASRRAVDSPHPSCSRLPARSRHGGLLAPQPSLHSRPRRLPVERPRRLGRSCVPTNRRRPLHSRSRHTYPVPRTPQLPSSCRLASQWESGTRGGPFIAAVDGYPGAHLGDRSGPPIVVLPKRYRPSHATGLSQGQSTPTRVGKTARETWCVKRDRRSPRRGH